MRKTLVLALALVLAIAGASFAAEVNIDAELKVEADWESDFDASENAKFFGPYTNEAKFELGLSFAGEGDVWDATVNVNNLQKETSLGFYRLNVNGEGFDAVAWGNHARNDHSIGDVGDALDFLTVSGNNMSQNPKIRVTTDVAGFGVTGQLDGGKFYVNGNTDVEAFKLGATLEHEFAKGSADGKNRFALYGGSAFGPVEVDAAFAINAAAKDKNNAMGVKASAQIIDELKVEALYQDIGAAYGSDDNSKYSLKGTYEEGLLQASVKHEKDTDDKITRNTVGATYRGSEDNLAFRDLFKEGDYHKNVAFAFGGEYKMSDGEDEAASTITLNAAGPVIPGQLAVRAQVTIAENKDRFKTGTGHPLAGITEADEKVRKNLEEALKEKDEEAADLAWIVEGHAKNKTTVTVNAHAPYGKFVFKPKVEMNQWKDVRVTKELKDEDDKRIVGAYALLGDVSKLTVELGVDYNLTEDTTIKAYIAQDSFSGDGDFEEGLVNRRNGVGITVKF